MPLDPRVRREVNTLLDKRFGASPAARAFAVATPLSNIIVGSSQVTVTYPTPVHGRYAVFCCVEVAPLNLGKLFAAPIASTRSDRSVVVDVVNTALAQIGAATLVTLVLPSGTVLTQVTRASCLARLMAIPLEVIPYSQSTVSPVTDRRADCTGLVSKVWATPYTGPGIYLHGYNTGAFFTQKVSERIGWAD